MIVGDGIMLGAGGETASIVVTAPTGSTVTCTTPNGIVLTAVEVSGTWTFARLKTYGTYTVTATNGSKSQSKNVLWMPLKNLILSLTFVCIYLEMVTFVPL